MEVEQQPTGGWRRRLKWLLIPVVVIGGWYGYLFITRRAPAANGGAGHQSVQLVSRASSTLDLSADVIGSMGIRTVPVIEAPPRLPLILSGSLTLDPDHMINIHTRFPGEVVAVGTIDDQDSRKTKTRTLQFGDAVKTGQLLATVWCRDVGEKKSDLVDALTRLANTRLSFERMQKLPTGAVADVVLREAKRAYEADVIQVERLERTLRSWRLADEEMAEVYAEATRIEKGQRDADPELEKTWGEIDIRAPFDGTILEKNIVVGDIVDAGFDLYMIADLRRLGVLANIYEEDLMALKQLKSHEHQWQIHVKAAPDLPPIYGEFTKILPVIDTTQHSGKVHGWVDNSTGKLFVGQFIDAVVPLPPGPGEVAVPESAILEEIPYSRVFVVENHNDVLRVSGRRVVLVRHNKSMAVIRSEPTEAERAAGAQPLRLGESVVANGVIELDAQLDELTAMAPQP